MAHGRLRCPACGALSTVVRERRRRQHSNVSFEKTAVNSGVLGGVSLMALAVIWFIVGWACGYIFYYPPALFLVGVIALVKGLTTGGARSRKRSRVNPRRVRP